MQTSVRAAAGARTGAHVGGWQRSSPAAPAPNRHPQRTRPRVASGGGGVASRPVVGGGGARRQARAWGEEGGEPRRPCRPARRRRARTPDGGRAKPPAAATNGGGVGGVARRGAACRALRASTPPPTGPLWRGGASLSRGGGRKPRLGRPDGTDGGDPMGVQSSREASGAHRGGSTAPRPLPCGPWGARCFKQRSVFQTAGARHGSAQRRRRGGDASASISSRTPPPPPLSARAAARTSTARVRMRGASSGSSGVYKGKASTVPRAGAVAPSSPADAAAVDGGGTLSGAGGSAVPHPSPPCALYLSHLCPAAAAALFVTLPSISAGGSGRLNGVTGEKRADMASRGGTSYRRARRRRGGRHRYHRRPVGDTWALQRATNTFAFSPPISRRPATAGRGWAARQRPRAARWTARPRRDE